MIGIVVVLFLVMFGLAILGGRASVNSGSSSPFSIPDLGTGESPRTDQHWHNPYAISVCGAFQPPAVDANGDLLGIHTHGDGIIHIHPFRESAAGKNATLKVFFEDIGVSLQPDSIQLPGGTTVRDCNGKPGHTVIYRWWLDDPTATPTIYRDNFDTIHFDHDRDAYTIAFSDSDAPPPQPPSIPYLSQLNDAPPTGGSRGTTSTTRRSTGSTSSTTSTTTRPTTTVPGNDPNAPSTTLD